MRSLTWLAVAPVLVLGFAACGDDSDGGGKEGKGSSDYAKTSVDQIQKDAATAMKGLDTVHLAGSIIDEKDGEIQADVTVSRAGDCTGTLALEGKGSVELLAVDGATYFKADKEFWSSQAGGDAANVIMGAVGDKWATDSTDRSGLEELCDLDNLLDQINKDDDIKGARVKGESEVDGMDTVEVAFTSDDGNPGSVHIAADDPHYIVKFDVPKEGTVTFSDFDEKLDVQKPKESEVFDLSTLGG